MNPQQAFNMGRIQLGMPTALVVLPMKEWDIPAGYTVEYQLDEVRDENGVTIDLSTIWNTVEINILPEANNATMLSMMFAGIHDTGSIAFYIMKNDLECVRVAFRILVGGYAYEVQSITDEPIGGPMFSLVSCTLWT